MRNSSAVLTASRRPRAKTTKDVSRTLVKLLCLAAALMNSLRPRVTITKDAPSRLHCHHLLLLLLMKSLWPSLAKNPSI